MNPNPSSPESRPSLEAVTGIEGLPPPAGPYSPGIAASGRFVFVSGQGPYDPAAGDFVCGPIGEQTRLTFACIDRILRKAGATRNDVVSCRVFLHTLNKDTFAEMNAAYREFFGAHKPARTTVGAQLLGIDVEIDCIAVLPVR